MDEVVKGVDLVADQTVLVEEQHRRFLAPVFHNVFTELFEDFGVGRVEIDVAEVDVFVVVDAHRGGGRPSLGAVLAGTYVTHADRSMPLLAAMEF